MRTLRLFITLSLSLLTSAPKLVNAQESSTRIFIAQEITPAFTPEYAYFILNIDEVSFRKVRAVLVPPFKKDEQDTATGKWLIGAALGAELAQRDVSYSVYVRSKEHAAFYPQLGTISKGSLDSHTLNAVKAELIKQKEILTSWQAQNVAQADAIRRLRSDADLIADVDRIVDVTEESEITKQEIANIEKDINALHAAFTEIKSMAAPKNYTRRELDLTKQLAELAGTVRQTEAGENLRKSKQQQDLQYKLELVESTRFDDETKLVAELAKLKAGSLAPRATSASDAKSYLEMQ